MGNDNISENDIDYTLKNRKIQNEAIYEFKEKNKRQLKNPLPLLRAAAFTDMKVEDVNMDYEQQMRKNRDKRCSILLQKSLKISTENLSQTFKQRNITKKPIILMSTPEANN